MRTDRSLSAKFAREFWSDSDGVILPYVAIMLGPSLAYQHWRKLRIRQRETLR